jgi:hypothetical protein
MNNPPARQQQSASTQELRGLNPRVLAHFKKKALRESIRAQKHALEDTLRRVMREKLKKAV